MHSYIIANMLRNTSEMVETHQKHQSIGYVRLYFYTGAWTTLYFGLPCKEEITKSLFSEQNYFTLWSLWFISLWQKLLCVWIWDMITKAHRTEKLLRREHEFSQLPTLKWWGCYKSYPWNTKVKGETSHVLTTALILLHLDSMSFTCRRGIVMNSCSQLLSYSTGFEHTRANVKNEIISRISWDLVVLKNFRVMR